MKLTERERVEVEHWRRWRADGGRELRNAPMALDSLIAIIDRIAPPTGDDVSETTERNDG